MEKVLVSITTDLSNLPPTVHPAVSPSPVTLSVITQKPPATSTQQTLGQSCGQRAHGAYGGTPTALSESVVSMCTSSLCTNLCSWRVITLLEQGNAHKLLVNMDTTDSDHFLFSDVKMLHIRLHSGLLFDSLEESSPDGGQRFTQRFHDSVGVACSSPSTDYC